MAGLDRETEGCMKYTQRRTIEAAEKRLHMAQIRCHVFLNAFPQNSRKSHSKQLVYALREAREAADFLEKALG